MEEIKLTWAQRVNLVVDLEKKVSDICKDHPRTQSEVEYLVELIMECHGIGDIVRSKDNARILYKEILGYMNFVHPCSPLELGKLMDLVKNPIIKED